MADIVFSKRRYPRYTERLKKCAPKFRSLWDGLQFALPMDVDFDPQSQVRDIVGGLTASGGTTHTKIAVPSKFGGMGINGAGAAQTVGDYAYDTSGAGEKAYVFVVKRSSGSSFQTLLEGDTNDNPYIGLDGNNFIYYMGGTKLSAAMSSNVWYAVVYNIIDSGNGELWLNGTRKATTADCGNSTSLEFGIFYRTGDSAFNGIIAQVLIYDRWLKPSEISIHSQHPDGMFRAGVTRLMHAAIPAAGGGIGIPIAAYHYNHHLGSMA